MFSALDQFRQRSEDATGEGIWCSGGFPVGADDVSFVSVNDLFHSAEFLKEWGAVGLPAG